MRRFLVPNTCNICIKNTHYAVQANCSERAIYLAPFDILELVLLKFPGTRLSTCLPGDPRLTNILGLGEVAEAKIPECGYSWD